jgi:hypothetical protein
VVAGSQLALKYEFRVVVEAKARAEFLFGSDGIASGEHFEATGIEHFFVGYIRVTIREFVVQVADNEAIAIVAYLVDSVLAAILRSWNFFLLTSLIVLNKFANTG